MKKILIASFVLGFMFAADATVKVTDIQGNDSDGYTIELGYISSEPIGGYQIHLLSDGALNVTGAEDAAEAGFTVSTGASGIVLGFSFTGATLPAATEYASMLTLTAESTNDVAVGTLVSFNAIQDPDNGTNFTQTLDNMTFQDVTFGNGIFVAVGNSEIIYTSTDGDTWTKVHP